MHYLALSIVASTVVLITFRWMHSCGAHTRHAITLNYAVAALTGSLIFSPGLDMLFMPWFWPAAIEGAVFYLIFQLMAKTTQVNGVAVASIATKTSVVIPIGIGIFLLGEDVTELKMLGVMAGFAAVLLSTGGSLKQGDWKWPLLVFIGTGCIDASFKLFQTWGVGEAQFPGLVTTIFAFAFLVGLIHHFYSKDKKISKISVISAVVLGLANFGTVFFLLQALAEPNWESSIVYPINNFGVIALSTLTAMIVFREKLNARGWGGVMLAVMAIGLLFLDSVEFNL
ncbi:MAG: EamA family transporter [Gammaproteobacteria bacterium]|nr:EamA family transporter [Gammaproteobacteria bacterium]